MRSFIIAALVGLVAGQSSTSVAVECHSNQMCADPALGSSRVSDGPTQTPSASSAVVSSSLVLSSSPLPSATTSGAKTAITVATDGSGQFTAINAGISAAQASGIPTVMVQSGVYTEAVTVLGTASVTIVGATATAAADWSQNQVTITNPLVPFSVTSSNLKGVTLRNLNLITTATGNAVAVMLRGYNNALYGCSVVSPGATTVSAAYGLAFIANSYIEGSDKLFYNYPTIYLYKSTIVPTQSLASLVYNKGLPSYNSTVVFDSCTVQQKSGYTNTNVYLAAPAAAGAVTIFRNTALGSLIAAAGVHPSAATYSSYYGEYQTTGAGSYAMKASSRSSYDHLLTADTVSQFTIDKVMSNAFAPYGNPSLGWIDQNVLASLQAANAVQPISVSSVVFTSTASVMSASSASSSCSPPAPSGTLIVSKTPGSCEYSNVTSAISALPNDKQPYTIKIGAGTYVEQLSITRNGKVTLIGATSSARDYTQNQVRIEISNGRRTNLGQNEQTPVLYAKKANDNSGLAVYNIDFVNTYPQTPDTAALAADFYGANIAAYGCSFIGYQDTLLANKGTQVFSNCYIEGSVDFVWGFSTAYFHQCMIVSNTPGACIAAQSRATADTPGGYIFDSCMVTYSSSYGSSYGLSYLGRPYSAYSIAVYMNSYIDKHINDAGWSVWQKSDPRTSGVAFGEFNNSGPGSWQTSTQRASFATNLTATEAAKYGLTALIGDTSWLDMNAYNQIPSYSLTGPSSSLSGVSSSSSISSSATSSSTATASGLASTSKINAHPESGTTPPPGAIIVSHDGAHNASFNTLTAALASLPSDSTNQTVFMYPGSYNEQIPPINRPGAVRIIGYTAGSSGQTYKNNQVTVSHARGLSVSPLPVGHSDSETAVIATASSRISFYNINLINTDNLDGSEANYVTLAASIYGNDIAFYGCSFDGWQDTLLTGATAGYQYYESCYIGGAIDFIWGYSKAYFKGCTIGAKRQSSAMTAQSRQSSSAIGGYIFDQCLFTAAPDATADLTRKVYLGRPYSQYALVVIKNSYIDSTINPIGWKIWSATDPRTASITFAEYNNVGPSNWENNAAARQSFGYATLLTSDTYPLASVMDSTEWIDMTFWSSIITPQPTTRVVIPPTNTTVNGTSAFNSTTPPPGALIVSKTPITGLTTYLTIQSALDAAPLTSKTNATIFIYPGVYEEQLIGFTNATDDYKQNQSGSNTDGATVYATGNYFHAYNINFRNNFGTQQDMASLGFAVKSSNQDTLSVSGNLFAFKTYIEGNVDFIYGSGSAYFLASTIATNEDGVSITASKRATNITSAGFVFDQCTLQPAAGLGPFSNVGLGRPWNSFSQVAYWSKEYHNYGPGASICNRARFSQQLSDSDVVQYQLVDTQPFSVGIGSAQTCASASTSISASTTRSASLSVMSLSSASSSTQRLSSLSPSRLPMLTTSTLISAPDVTSTSILKQTLTITESGIDLIKTSTRKATATVSYTSPDVYSTLTYITTEVRTIVESVVTTKAAATSTAATITSTQGSTSITTKTVTIEPKDSVTKTTTTLSCIPTAEVKHMVRRGALIPRAAANITTLTYTATFTTYVKTLTATQPGSTSLTTLTSVAATKTTSIKGSTITSTITAVVATSTDDFPGSTHLATITSTSKIDKTTTLKAVTTDKITITSLNTQTKDATIVAARPTIIVTRSSDITSTVRSTLPVRTETKYQTITEGGGTTSLLVTAASKTTTVVQKSTVTIVALSTKTSKGAEICTA
ncbi:carbohydrate esterase family 8 protein [Plenodomus tracheiphilus IPT5]|uniref:pectinesterase n=1 Tax=Plenodomus tracheiphilus IPT5 TaxID=1408161 RepID=A0A6A7BBP7_9PLEO|nr:carbohydrate esterase family 8 protein [Plenodomus tracheiphilus IPT5]